MKKNTPKPLLIVFLLAGFACTNKPAENAQEESETSAPGADIVTAQVTGNEITYTTDGTTMKGYLAYDASKDTKRPGILVVHEWWGHNDYARKRAEMLAELGYVALAVDMYGEGQTASHPDDAGKFAMSVMSNIEEGKTRFVQAMKELKAHPSVDSTKIGAIGYCFGGSVALSMANMGLDLDAVAAFHSGVELPAMPGTGELKAKVLVCNGAQDSFVSPGSVEAFKAAMDSIEADYQYIAYEGAVHSFTSPDADSLGKQFNLPLAYNAEADRKSWEEMKSLFSSVFE